MCGNGKPIEQPTFDEAEPNQYPGPRNGQFDLAGFMDALAALGEAFEILREIEESHQQLQDELERMRDDPEPFREW